MAGKNRARGTTGSGSSRRSTAGEEEEQQSPEVEESPEGSTAEESSHRGQESIKKSEDGRIIINPRRLWFKSSIVVRGCTSSTKKKTVGGVATCWSMATDAQMDEWFNLFRQYFT